MHGSKREPLSKGFQTPQRERTWAPRTGSARPLSPRAAGTAAPRPRPAAPRSRPVKGPWPISTHGREVAGRTLQGPRGGPRSPRQSSLLGTRVLTLRSLEADSLAGETPLHGRGLGRRTGAWESSPSLGPWPAACRRHGHPRASVGWGPTGWPGPACCDWGRGSRVRVREG